MEKVPSLYVCMPVSYYSPIGWGFRLFRYQKETVGQIGGRVDSSEWSVDYWQILSASNSEQVMTFLECVSCLSLQSIRWCHDRSRQTLWCGEVRTIPHDMLRLWKGISVSVTPVYCCSFLPILVRVTIVLCAFVVSENQQLSVVCDIGIFVQCCQFRSFHMAWIGYERNDNKRCWRYVVPYSSVHWWSVLFVGVSEESSLAMGE